MDAIDVSASGLAAQRRRLDAISRNIANAETTRTAQGGPYRRQQVAFQSDAKGVQIAETTEDTRPGKVVYRPGHPDADAKGFVTMPNVNVTEEIVDMVTATRSYEANIAAVDAAKTMIRKALEIVR
jgi:flagellar basal-body rod protein FlgC